MIKRTFNLWWALILVLILAGPAFGGAAGTHTTFVTGNPVYNPQHAGEVFVLSNRLDFADLKRHAGGGVTTADVVQLLDIPAGTWISETGVSIAHAWSIGSGTTFASVCTIGDGADVDGWITSFSPTHGNSGVSLDGGAYANGKYYGTTDTIDMVVGSLTGTVHQTRTNEDSGCTDTILEVWAVGFQPSQQEAYTH